MTSEPAELNLEVIEHHRSCCCTCLQPQKAQICSYACIYYFSLAITRSVQKINKKCGSALKFTFKYCVKGLNKNIKCWPLIALTYLPLIIQLQYNCILSNCPFCCKMPAFQFLLSCHLIIVLRTVFRDHCMRQRRSQHQESRNISHVQGPKLSNHPLHFRLSASVPSTYQTSDSVAVNAPKWQAGFGTQSQKQKDCFIHTDFISCSMGCLQFLIVWLTSS